MGARLAGSLGCVQCHGAQGVSDSSDVPNLAGLDRTYLLAQLQRFARERLDRDESAERRHTGMECWSRRLEPEQMAALAEYYARFVCLPRASPEAAPMPEAARACVACHGPYGVNLTPGVPDLTGQKFAYLLAQLRAFRRTHFGSAPASADNPRDDGAMARHAIELDDAEIAAVAGFFSTLGCR